MSVGYPIDKNTLDQRAGNHVFQLRETFERVQIMKGFLDGFSVAQLQSAYGYTEDEATTLKAAYTALDKLRQIATGQAVQTPADDFFFHARKLTGLE